MRYFAKSNFQKQLDVLYKKGVLRNFEKLTGKQLCQSLSFNKVGGLRPATLLQKNSGRDVFCKFCEISKNTFFTEHLWWLLLNFAGILLQKKIVS